MVESYEELLLRLEGELLGKASVSGWISALDSVLGSGSDVAVIRKALSKVAPPSLRLDLLATMGEAVDAALGTSARLIEPALANGSTAAAAALKARAFDTFRLSPELLSLVRDFDPDARTALSIARITAASGGDADAIFAHLREARRRVTMTTTRVVNQAANEATRHVATVSGLPVVWVAERNACVRCLAYSGVVAHEGAEFPGGLTYSSAGAAHPGLHSPPLHPYCRCHLEALRDQSYADALRREADRSVLRGFALPSESRSVRIDAAQHLLDNNVQAPKSVIAFAKRSIKKGNFGTPLRTPGGPPHDFTPGAPPTQPPTPPRSPKTPPSSPPPPKVPTPPPTFPKSPSSAPKVTPPAPKKSPSSTSKPTPAKASEKIFAASNVSDVTAAFTAAHGTRTALIGFERKGMHLQSTKDALGTLSDLLDDFPNVKLASISVERLGPRVLAAVWTPRVGGAYGVPSMKIAPGSLTNAPKLKAAIEASNKGGHFHNVDPDHGMIHTVTHEFGHVLDSNLQQAGRVAAIRAQKAALDKLGTPNRATPIGKVWTPLNLSGYARTSPGEHFAEAFADARILKDKALPLSLDVHAEALRLAKDANL